MPLPFRFSKATAQRHLSAVIDNKPIHAGDEGWTQTELLQAASALLLLAYGCGPPNERHSPENLEKIGSEQTEAILSRYKSEFFATSELLTHWTQMVLDEEYDQEFDPVVMAQMEIDAAGEMYVTYFSGSKVPDTWRQDREMDEEDLP